MVFFKKKINNPSLISEINESKFVKEKGFTEEALLRMFQILKETLSNVLSDLDLQTITQKVADSMAKELEYPGGVVLLVDETGQYAYPYTFSNVPIVNTSRKLFDSTQIKYYLSSKSNYIERAASEKKIYISNKQSEHISPQVSKYIADVTQKISGTKTTISVPVIAKDKVLAVMLINSNRTAVSDEEMLMLKTYADQFGLAINHSKLFEEKRKQLELVQAQNKDLASLFNLSSNIAKSLDPVEVAQIAANALPQDDTMVGAIITNYSEMSNTINVQAVSQNAISNAAKQILGDFSKYVLELSNENARLSPTGRAIIQERPVFTNDIAAAFDPPIPNKFLKPIEKLLGIKSIAVYPVIARGELKGTVGFLLKQHLAEEVTDAQKQLFQTYTSQIAIALENAKLFETSQRIQASLESALKELKEAREKERDMIDIMGHELRTPMSIVRNSLGMMEMHLKQKGKIPEDKQQKYVDTALESAKREINLIETLLSATKADSKGFDLTLEKIDFNDVVNDSVEAFSKQAEKKGLTLTVNKPQMPIYVYADRTRAQEIADNFIGNAVKYTPSGSVTITVEQKGDDAWITIADTGYGISEEDLQKLGHKFFRARQHTNEVSSSEEITNTKVPNQANSPAEEKVAAIIRPGGTGLGLYVSFSLIYIMGGKLIVESTLGQGSIFSFALPIYKDQKLDQDQKQVDGNNLPIRISGNKLTIN